MARRLAEVGAAVGRAFPLGLLQETGFGDEEVIVHVLDELWQRRIVHEKAANVWDFTHDKIRDVVYAETAPPQRRYLHRRIALALETLHKESLEHVSGEIAVQLEQAGLLAQAVPYYRQAGTVAAAVYANEDAIELFTRGLRQLMTLPPGNARDIQELDFQMALAKLYRLTFGWASPKVESALMRATKLGDSVGNVDQRIQILFGLQTLFLVQAKYHKVEDTYAQVDRLYREARHAPPPPFIGISLAGARILQGQMMESRKLFETMVAVRDEKHILDLQESQGVNYLVLGLAWNAHALWCLGYPDSALASAHASIQIARQFAQPFNQALACTYFALLQEWCASASSFRAGAEQALELSSECKAQYYHAWAKILVEFAHASPQPDADRLANLYNAIDDFAETGAHARLPIYLSQLARACSRAGRAREGLALIEQALAESAQNNEHCWDAELHRLVGELRRMQGAEQAEIEAAFRQSMAVARAQQAKSLELRAGVSLARLWQANGQSRAAKQLLEPIYGWFTEGFDTPDLQSARALLAQL
jgi:hypothetical protein